MTSDYPPVIGSPTEQNITGKARLSILSTTRLEFRSTHVVLRVERICISTGLRQSRAFELISTVEGIVSSPHFRVSSASEQLLLGKGTYDVNEIYSLTLRIHLVGRDFRLSFQRHRTHTSTSLGKSRGLELSVDPRGPFPGRLVHLQLKAPHCTLFMYDSPSTNQSVSQPFGESTRLILEQEKSLI